jgi:hypothetical protein
MGTDNLITAEQLAGALKMAGEGIKKKPGLMKSTVASMKLVHKYVERIVTAKDKGKWVATHGTQQPIEIYEAMDVVGLFIEFWGVISDAVKLEVVPEALTSRYGRWKAHWKRVSWTRFITKANTFSISRRRPASSKRSRTCHTTRTGLCSRATYPLSTPVPTSWPSNTPN